MRRFLCALVTVSSVALTAPARGQLVQYAAPSGSFAPTTVVPHVTATPLDDTGSAADLQPGVGLADTVFLQQNVLSADPTAAVANGQFFHFAVGPELGYTLNLSSLAFDATRGGASTPRGWAIRSSLDGYSTTIATGEVPTQNPTLTNFNVPLPAAFQNVTSPVDFRIYGYAPSTGVGMFYDNLALGGSLLANTLVRYEAPGGSFTPTVIGDRVLASNLSDLGSAGDLQPGVGLADTVFLQQNVQSTTAAAAVANGQYFQFSAVAEEGFELDLLSLTFDATRGGSSTPRGWVLRSSLDNFAADIASAELPTQNPTLTHFNVDLTAAAFQDVTSQITFRLYGYAPTAGVGAFYDNIELHGLVEAAPVPEPSATAALLAVVAGAAARVRRPKRDRTIA